MFILLMKRNLQQFALMGKDEEIRILAAAYNFGFRTDIETLKAISQKSFFYTGIIPAVTKYNYSDIAAAFFSKYCGM